MNFFQHILNLIREEISLYSKDRPKNKYILFTAQGVETPCSLNKRIENKVALAPCRRNKKGNLT